MLDQIYGGSGRAANPTMTALEGAVGTAASFVDFAITIETIALDIETRQTVCLVQVAKSAQEQRQQQLQVVGAVLIAKNDAIAAIPNGDWALPVGR